MSPHMDAKLWIEQRNMANSVTETGGRFKATFHGKDVGTFNTRAEAFKAYYKAVVKEFGDKAALPTEQELDEELK